MNGIWKTLASVGLILTIAAPAFAQQLKATEDVRTALKLLVQVSNDFKRQITNKNFTRVPHEFMEYTEAADALRSSTKDEPVAFKNRVDMRLKAAVGAYQKVSDMSAKETDVDKLMA